MTPDRVAFSIFGLDVMWYGILIAAGMIIAVAISYYRAPKHGISQDNLLNIILIAIPFGIIGARLYFVVFNWEDYADDLLRIFNTRSGGLAIHGGLIFGILAGVIACRIWKEKPLNVIDTVVPSIALAQSIGRWGNYINAEAYGSPTDLPWAITVDGVKVHPTFLYESIWCLILFFILIYIDNRKKFTGQTFLLYAILYSAERFFVEALRTDSLMFMGIIKQAQLLSVIMIIASVCLYIYLYRKNKIGK